MFKKITALFFVMLFVFLSAPVSSFAKEIEAVTYKDLDATAIESDLSDFDLSNFVVNKNIKNVSIFSLAEQGVNSASDYKDAKLYIYVYNPSGDTILASGKNYVQMLTEENTIGEKYKLKFIDSNDSGTLIKFKIELPVSYFASIISSARAYRITEMELETNKGLKAYDVGGTYIFENYGTKSKLAKVSTFETVSLNVKSTVFRTSSSLGEDYRNQLASVYFTVPNYYEEKYGSVYGIDCTYEKYYTKPFIVTNSETLALQLRDSTVVLLPLTEMEHSNLSEDYYSPSIQNGLALYTIMPMANNTVGAFNFHWWYNVNFDEFLYNPVLIGSDYASASFDRQYGAEILPVVLYTEQEFNADFWISSEEVQDAMNNFYKSYYGNQAKYKNAFIGDYYHSLLYEDYYLDSEGIEHRFEKRTSNNGASYISAIVRTAITFDSEKFNMFSYSSSHNWIQKINDFGLSVLWKKIENDVTYEDISRVEKVSSRVAGFADDAVSDAYLVGEHDVVDFKAEVANANANDGTVFLFRVDVAPYYSVDLYTTKPIDNKVVGHAIAFREPVYMGFDVINLKFKSDDGDVINVPVTSTPNDVIGGVNAPMGDTIKNSKGIDWEKIKRILTIVLVVLAVVFVLPYVVRLVNSVNGGYKKYSNKARRRVKRGKRK